jgi:hypothetical protein
MEFRFPAESWQLELDVSSVLEEGSDQPFLGVFLERLDGSGYMSKRGGDYILAEEGVSLA